MGIVAISQTLGSLGEEIGRAAAEALGYRYADREILLQAAAQFGEGIETLEHLTEARPTLWERLSESRQRYLAYVEAVIWEQAAGDDVVLVGRGAPFVLANVRHALRVRISAPLAARARRLETEQGLIPDVNEVVRRSDRERAARMRFLYHVAWDDATHYDLVLNTERLDVTTAVPLVLAATRGARFRATPDARGDVVDRSLVARAEATLLANPTTRDLGLFLHCTGGHLSASGRVAREAQRQAAEEALRGIPGVGRVSCEITVMPPLSSPTPP